MFEAKLPTVAMAEYIENLEQASSKEMLITRYSPEDYDLYSSSVANPDVLRPGIEVDWTTFVSDAELFLQRMLQVFTVIGVFVLGFQFRKHPRGDFLVLAFTSILILIFFKLVPVSNIFYDPMRLHYQLLTLLSFPAVFGIIGTLHRIRLHLDTTVSITVFVLVAYFVFTSGMAYHLFGGRANLQTNNVGQEYDIWYVTKGQTLTSTWLISHGDRRARIFISRNDFAKYPLLGNPYLKNVRHGILPSTMDKDSYALLDTMNVRTGKGFLFPDDATVIYYNLPLEFLHSRKNRVYANKDGEIFK